MAIARFLECRVVATSNITHSGQPQTIDGVSVATGNSVLAVGQTASSQNGVWTVAAGVWTRAPNALIQQDFLGMTVVVREGAHADTMWQCRNDPPITVGTTALRFAQLPSLADKDRIDRLNAQQLASEMKITDTDATISASGGVKIVEIGRFENRCIRGRIPVKRRCPRLGSRRKMAEEDIAVPRRFSNRLNLALGIVQSIVHHQRILLIPKAASAANRISSRSLVHSSPLLAKSSELRRFAT